MDETTPAVVATSTKPRSTDFSIAAIMSKDLSSSNSNSNNSPSTSPCCYFNGSSPTKIIGKLYRILFKITIEFYVLNGFKYFENLLSNYAIS